MFILNKSQNLAHGKFSKLHILKYGKWMKTLEHDTNNHIHLKWFYYLPSFFKFSKPSWSMIVVKKEVPNVSTYQVMERPQIT
jgi:hypothetical protein